MERNKLILSGVIDLIWDNWSKILLIQPDGYKIDLVNRLNELFLNSDDAGIQLNYHLCDSPLDEIELKEAHILSISGGLQSEYETNSYHYSSYTHGTDYDTKLNIGGHNLFSELCDENGKWVYFEINYTLQK